MLVAAAAAIASEFAPLPDPKPLEAGISPAGDLGHVESLQPDPLIFDEPTVVQHDTASSEISESAYPEPEGSGANHGIVFIDLESDNSLFVPEEVAADKGAGEGAVPQLTATDLLSDGAAGNTQHFVNMDTDVAPIPLVPATDELHASASEVPTADVAPIPPLPAIEELHASAGEVPAEAEEVSAPPASTWVPNYFLAEGTGDEAPAPDAVDTIEEVSTVSDEESGGSASETEDDSGVVKGSGHGAALIRQPRPDARRWIVLKASHSGTASSENASGFGRRNDFRSGRNLPVPARSLTARPPRRRFLPRWPISTLQTGILALALVDCLLVGWRTDIVRKLPQTASFYELAGLPVNLRGLAFHGITTSAGRDGGTPVLVVEGDIVNKTAKVLRVPQLRFAVRDDADQEIYSWTATVTHTSLPPGQALTFHARLAAPPAGARDVVLRFVNRSDIVAMNP